MAEEYFSSQADLGGGFRTQVEMGISLSVTDIDRSLSFYRDALGFELMRDEEDPAENSRLASLRYGNVVLDLVQKLPPIEPRRDFRLYWASEKLEEALGVVVDGGGRVQRVMEYGVHCVDPDGHPLIVLPLQPEVDDLSI